MAERRCPPAALVEHCTSVLSHSGLPQEDARLVADSLVHANLRGIDSHGVTRLAIYVERLRRQLVEPNPKIEVLEDKGGSFLVDGGNGMGAVVTARVLELALDRLEELGSVSVAIRNSNHYGAGAFYAERAVARDALLFMYSNAPSTMAPWGGMTPFLGTNPYTFAAPAARRDPLILDMATSVVARGKIILAANRGESIPSGWAIDAQGRSTTDAQAALEGSVLPFGGPKGYGIALMIDIMAGVMTGAGFGQRIGDLYREMERPQNVGAFLQLTHAGAFMPAQAFKERMDSIIDEIKSVEPAPGVDEVLVPGELERRNVRRRSAEGVPLEDALIETLETLGRAADVSLSHVLDAA